MQKKSVVMGGGSSSVGGILHRHAHRALFSLRGPDAMKFLQGVTTNDVHGMDIGTAQYTAFLTPKGRILTDAQLIKMNEEEMVVDVGQGQKESVLRHLKRYMLRSRIEMTEWPEHQVWTKITRATPHPSNVEENVQSLYVKLSERSRPSSSSSSSSPILAFHDPRGLDFGFRFITDVTPTENDALMVEDQGQAYDVFRLSMGLLEGDELVDRIPAECNLDLLNGIAFSKGCYVGQELTARTQFKGTIRKRALPVQILPLNTVDNVNSSNSTTALPSLWSELGNPPLPSLAVGDALENQHHRRVGRWIALSSKYAIGVAQVRLNPVLSDIMKGENHPLVLKEKQQQPYQALPYLPSWWPTHLDLETGKPKG